MLVGANGAVSTLIGRASKFVLVNEKLALSEVDGLEDEEGSAMSREHFRSSRSSHQASIRLILSESPASDS